LSDAASDRTGCSTGSRVTCVSAAVLFAACLLHVVAGGLTRPGAALAFGMFVAMGELVRLRLPGEREAAPIGAAAALAYCLVPRFPDGPAQHGASQVLAVVGTGIALGALPHVLAGRRPRPEYVARRILVVAGLAVVFRPVGVHRALVHLPVGTPLAVAMVLAVVVAVCLDALLAATAAAWDDRRPWHWAARDELTALLGIGSAMAATGMLIALAVGVMGLWALPVFSAPLLLTQFSFRRFAAGRASHQQTVRALSRVTEVGGLTTVGHAARVAELARAVGRQLGLSESALLDLECAALMHDLGQLALEHPIPRGATVLVDAGERRRIAEEGALVVATTSASAAVGEIVARQADPYRRPHEASDPTLPTAARILRVVNAFDDLAGAAPDPDRRSAALERIRLGMAYDYDPVVVEVLAGIVERTPASR
jgi:hypothetical protein